MKYLTLLFALLVGSGVVQADDFPTDIKSSEVKEAIESFEQMKKSTTTLVTAKIRTYRQELIDKLKAQQKTVTMAGDLEEALKIKSLVGKLETVQASVTELVVAEGEKAAGKISIPRGAVKFGNSRYYVVTDAVPWHVAAKQCGLAGGHLLRIDSQEEHQFITKLIQSLGIQSKHHHYHYLWIDGNDEIEPKVYRDSRGQKIEYLPWAQGEPGNPGFDATYHLLINITHSTLHNHLSSTRRYYICEWE